MRRITQFSQMLVSYYGNIFTVFRLFILYSKSKSRVGSGDRTGLGAFKKMLDPEYCIPVLY
jgi:hypothetical protein